MVQEMFHKSAGQKDKRIKKTKASQSFFSTLKTGWKMHLILFT